MGKIKNTINEFLPGAGIDTEKLAGFTVYPGLQRRIGAIEEFVSVSGFPDVCGLAREVILYHASKMHNPQIVPASVKRNSIYNFTVLLISPDGRVIENPVLEQGEYMLGIRYSHGLLIGGEGRGEACGFGPSINISTAGDGFPDHVLPDPNGAILKFYNTPPEIAAPLLADFVPAKIEERNARILELAEYMDLVNCYSPRNVESVTKDLHQGETPFPGINEQSIRVFKKAIDRNACFGYAYGYNHEDYLSISLRIEREGGFDDRIR